MSARKRKKENKQRICIGGSTRVTIYVLSMEK